MEITDSASLQKALEETSLAVFEEAKRNKEPLYYGYYGYSIEYWADTKSIFIECTLDVANKLGIPLEELKNELES
jgi:hypothetical protein